MRKKILTSIDGNLQKYNKYFELGIYQGHNRGQARRSYELYSLCDLPKRNGHDDEGIKKRFFSTRSPFDGASG